MGPPVTGSVGELREKYVSRVVHSPRLIFRDCRAAAYATVGEHEREANNLVELCAQSYAEVVEGLSQKVERTARVVGVQPLVDELGAKKIVSKKPKSIAICSVGRYTT
jgi:hypothetical protein